MQQRWKHKKNNLEDFKKIQAEKYQWSWMQKLYYRCKLCTDEDDILLSTKNGKCIRTPVSKLRTTKSRSSVGVRGIKLGSDDKIISLSIISHMDVTSDEAKAYLKQISESRKSEMESNGHDDAGNDEDEVSKNLELNSDRFDEMKAREQFILTVTEMDMENERLLINLEFPTEVVLE